MIERRIPTRMTDVIPMQVGAVDDGVRKYYDQMMEMTVVKLITGDCYVTAAPRELLITILGSCISVCIRDTKFRIGGMNHILLPGDSMRDDPMKSARYGVFAMEELINGIMHHGGRKENFEVKIFGGGNVIDNSSRIGDKNIEFVTNFCRDENLPIVASNVGGVYPRRIHYYPDTGKVRMRLLKRKEDLDVVKQEVKYGSNQAKLEVSADFF